MMLRSSKAMWWAGGAALWCAQGCMTLDDLTMKEDAGDDGAVVEVEDDAASPGADAEAVEGDDAGEVPVELVLDSGALADASQPLPDAGREPPDRPQPDGSIQMPPPDATVPVVPSCVSSADCESDEFCGPGAVCQPKCNADGACVVHEIPIGLGVAQFASDDQALYFLINGVGGNQITNGEIWRREPGQAPTLVTDQTGTSGEFAVRDGYAYFRRGARFFRTQVLPQSPAQELYVVPGGQDAPWTIGDGFLVVSVHDGFWFGSLDGTQALRKIESELVGSPPSVVSSGDRFYFSVKSTVDDHELTRVKSVRMVEPYAIEDASPVVNIDGHVVEVHPPYAYFGWQVPQRLNLGNGEVELVAAPAPDHSPDSRFHISGDWLYYYRVAYADASAPSRIDRYSLRVPISPLGSQVVLRSRPAATSAAAMTMRVMGERLYTAVGGRLIYEFTLPPELCNAYLSCPAGKTCGTDSFCH